MPSRSPRAVWQVSGGFPSRAYADVLLRHGVALIGPGDAGPWNPSRDDSEFGGAFVRRFASEVEAGDILLLRTGIATVAAVGIVAGDYLHLEAFDEVNGWDLQHARRVHWCRLPEEYVFPKSVFGANPPRISRLWAEEAVDFAGRFVNSPPTTWQTAPLPPLPAETPPLDQIPESLQEIVAEASDLVPLMLSREAFGAPPAEDELIGHFVLRFLRALGWPPECLAVQWRCIDVAVFRCLPRVSENCRFVIEAKRLGSGVEGALDQARGYVEALGVLRDIVVTDGIRYRMYAADRGFAPVAYANLVRLKQPATELFARMRRL